MTPVGSQTSMRPLRTAFPKALPALSSIPEVFWKSSYFSENGKLLVLKIGEQQKTLLTQFENIGNKIDLPEKEEQHNNTTERSNSLDSDSRQTPSYQDKPISVKVPFISILATYIGVGFVIILFGNIQDMIRKYLNFYRLGEHRCPRDTSDFVDVYGQGYDTFIRRNFFNRCRDCFNRPIVGCPGALVKIQNRIPILKNWFVKFFLPKEKPMIEVLNLGSYNYLGFANTNGHPANQSVKAVQEFGISATSPLHELGNMTYIDKLEGTMAQFMGTEACAIFGMGFATNSMNICNLADKGGNTLFISDSLNHASIVTGCKLAGASIRTFSHNDMKDLEKVLRSAVFYGNPKKRNRPYSKIIIVSEGIYSMEGTIVNLPGIIELKKKYKAYLYLDEAHSIGAIGQHGRGVTEYFNCDPTDVDILMGTFTKSFGAAGGYICGKRSLINHIRNHSAGNANAVPMPPAVAAQTLAALNIIGFTKQGQDKINQLRKNTHKFRSFLKTKGFCVYGHDDSPVVPVLTCEIGKMAKFDRLALEYGLGLVMVGFPATPMTESRIRFCLSAAHTEEQLDRALAIIDMIADECGIKFIKE